MGGLEFVGLELLTVFPINDPLACRFNMFARRDRGRAADDRHQVLPTLDLNLEDGKAILRVVVGDPLDQSFEGFGHYDCEHSGATPSSVVFQAVISPHPSWLSAVGILRVFRNGRLSSYGTICFSLQTGQDTKVLRPM